MAETESERIQDQRNSEMAREPTCDKICIEESGTFYMKKRSFNMICGLASLERMKQQEAWENGLEPNCEAL